MARRFQAAVGYEVIEAASGVEALSVLEKNAAISLLFTDIIMPGPLNGRKPAERAAAFNPAIKILFTSGYGRLDPGVEFLSKPYDRERMAMKIRRVLDGPAKKIDGSQADGTDVVTNIPGR
jgi:CheY-like chemotaxis protein